MSKSLIFRNSWLGFLSWLIPFAISFFCYKSGGDLVMDYSTFKSLMIVSGTVSGCFLLFQYFKVVISNFILNSVVVVGLSWFIINILLDTIILIPMMKVTFATYFMSIGLGYISIPAISVTIGFLLNRKIKIS